MKKINLKQLDRIHRLENIQEEINKLEHDKFHALFYIKNLNFKNLLNPLFSLTRLVHKINGDLAIDHVGYIKGFDEIDSTSIYKAETVDAMLSGVEINDLLDFVKHYDGRVIIATFDKFDKKIIKDFTKKIHGLPYGEMSAAMSALDSDTINDITKKLNFKVDSKDNEEILDISLEKIFCSFKTALLLEKLGHDTSIIENGVAKEMTPYNVFQLALHYASSIKLFCKK